MKRTPKPDLFVPLSAREFNEALDAVEGYSEELRRRVARLTVEIPFMASMYRERADKLDGLALAMRARRREETFTREPK